MFRQLPASWDLVKPFLIAARARTCPHSRLRAQRHLFTIHRLHRRLQSLQATLA